MDRSTPVLVSKSGKSSDSKPGSKLDDLGFLELVPGNDPIVDIVAIHGLQGHREKSWMTDDGVCWLRHLLPSDLPNVRILSYGYDADTRSRECVSTQTLGRHADGFAYALSRERKDAPRRPIIFVAHDVGGIVLKSALVICHNQNLDSDCQLRNILVSTHGILFFGTPHFGLEGTTYHEVLNRLASVYMETTNIILKDLEDYSSELEHIQRLYASASEKISSIFFCEEYATSGISNLSEVNVPHHKAIIAGDRNATTIVLHANHRNLVRFTSKGNDNYRTVRYHLEAYVDHGPEAVCKEWVREDDCRNAAKGKSAPEPGVMPKPRPVPSRTYIERKNIEYLITQKLLQTGQGKRQPRCILYGLGGSGKTQLATKWIQDHEHNFSRVIFVDASSQQHLEADLERSIRSLGPEYAKMTWNDAVAYLDGKEKGWLLFFDNADSEKLELRPYLPGSVHGTILITTRNAHCNKYARDGAVHVGDLEDNEAVNLLHTIANVAPASDVESLKIVRELGMLALAITQAGAYIGNTRRLDTYLDTFHEHRDQLLRSKPEIDAEYAFSTYAAFDLFFKNLPENTQELLKLCASLHYSLIPIDLFRRSIQSEFSAYSVRNSLPPPESDQTIISRLIKIPGSTWNEVAFQRIVDPASHGSFISISSDGLFYTFHPLFQMYLKDRLGGEEGRCYARMTAQLLLGAIRPIKDSNAWSWQLLPHVDRIPRSVQLESVAHALAFHELYNSVGNWKACQELLEPALTQLGQNEGQRNEDSLFVISRLADALQRDGQLSRAEKMQRDVLALRLEIHGEWHLDTISAMSNLADTLSRSGQLDKAETMARKVLTLRLEILGQRHPDTISATRNVAATLYRRGQLEEAEKMEREVLTQRVEILGKRHPDTISAMNSLAATLHKGGQLDEAEKLIREVLALRLEILGKRHPDTIVAVNNLATTLWKCGQWDEAEKMEREVLALQTEILGRRHLDTISVLHNLAVTVRDRGQLDEAEKMEREALALRLEILGRKNIDTISTMGNLAITLSNRGDLHEAETLEREVLALRLEILGRRNLDTISAMRNLAITLYNRGQLDEAEKLERDVLALRLKILGRQHKDTIMAMRDLALTLYRRSQRDGAEKIEQGVKSLLPRIFGRRKALRALSHSRFILQKSGQLEESANLLREAMKLLLRTSPQDPRHLDDSYM